MICITKFTKISLFRISSGSYDELLIENATNFDRFWLILVFDKVASFSSRQNSEVESGQFSRYNYLWSIHEILKPTNQNHFASGRRIAHNIKNSRSFRASANQNNPTNHVTHLTQSRDLIRISN